MMRRCRPLPGYASGGEQVERVVPNALLSKCASGAYINIGASRTGTFGEADPPRVRARPKGRFQRLIIDA